MYYIFFAATQLGHPMSELSSIESFSIAIHLVRSVHFDI